MSINAGFSGQSFIDDYAKKIQSLKDKTWIPIALDGGINKDTISKARNFGAQRFVVNSFLFNYDDPQKQYDILNSLLMDSSV